MANGKLHIICGNCGCNHMFDYKIVKELDDDTDETHDVVYIGCKNCGTLHDLNNNAKKQQNNGK